MTVPFNFATQSGNIPLSELDANFANVSASTLTATFVTGNNQSNITNVGTLNSLAVYGNVSAGNVSTNGIVRANAVVSVNYTGTNVSVTGNITGANLNVSNLFETGNITATGNITTGNLIATGNITGNNVETVNLMVNRISSDDSSYVTVDDGLQIRGDLISESLGVAGNTIMNNLTVTGNFVGTDIQVNSIVNGSSNVDITNTNGNVTIGVDGVNNVLVVTSTGADVAGNISGYNLVINTIASDDSTAVSVLDNLSVHGDIDAIGDISATGNIIFGNIIIPNGGKIIGDFTNTVSNGRTVFQTSVANGATVLTAVPDGTNTTAGLALYNSSNTTNFGFGAVTANTTGVFIRSGNVGNAAPLPILFETGSTIQATIDINGNVGIGNATPVDTLSVGGNAYVSGNITAGNLAATNLVINTISSDDSTYVFVEDGLEVHGDILADGEISAVGNVVTGGVVSATGNVVTGGVVSATGNVSGGNVVTGGVVSATGTVTGGNVVTGGVISATGTVTGGNILTSGLISATGTVTSNEVSATGNVTGGNIVIPNGRKITGDFGTSVAGGRTIFQTSVTNGSTILTAVPAGAGNTSGLVAYNTSDTVNYVGGAVIANATAISLRSSNIGNAAPLPILFETGNVVRTTIDVNGNVGIANTAPVDTLSVGGNAYVSGKVTTLPTALANLTAVAGARAFINNANLVASGNFGTLVGAGGANVVPVWSDGSNWYIG